jgi:archaellum component FlaC
MNDDQFTKLFTYVEKRFDAVDEHFDRQNQRFDDVTNLIDGYAGKLDNYAQEMAAMDHKIMRLEKYIQVLADKAGVDLDAIHI